MLCYARITDDGPPVATAVSLPSIGAMVDRNRPAGRRHPPSPPTRALSARRPHTRGRAVPWYPRQERGRRRSHRSRRAGVERISPRLTRPIHLPSRPHARCTSRPASGAHPSLTQPPGEIRSHEATTSLAGTRRTTGPDSRDPPSWRSPTRAAPSGSDGTRARRGLARRTGRRGQLSCWEPLAPRERRLVPRDGRHSPPR